MRHFFWIFLPLPVTLCRVTCNTSDFGLFLIYTMLQNYINYLLQEVTSTEFEYLENETEFQPGSLSTVRFNNDAHVPLWVGFRISVVAINLVDFQSFTETYCYNEDKFLFYYIQFLQVKHLSLALFLWQKSYGEMKALANQLHLIEMFQQFNKLIYITNMYTTDL